MAMKIVDMQKLSVRDLVAGYIDDPLTRQVTAMNGRLNVRPAYQREFVWDKGSASEGKKKQALIDSILNGYPINVMYWVRTGQNSAGEDMYECLDGQQRIITMSLFHQNAFGLADGTQFDGLTDNTKFLDYDKFIVYVCEADTLDEKLAWFERINTAGEPLTSQEMRSAIACGAGTTAAKKYFVDNRKNGANAYSFDAQSGHPGNDYVTGEWDRQAIYEKVVTWHIGSKKPEAILAYMKNHRDDVNAADELFEYFKNVIRWVKRLFPTYHKDMAKVEWGLLYNEYKNNTSLAAATLERQISFLRADIGKDGASHLESSKGIYEYVLAINNGVSQRDAIKFLSPRTFTAKDKAAQYERQRHVCPHCMKRFEDISMMDGDHIVPYNPIPSSGQANGTTTPDNLQMLCHRCNNDKSNKPFDKAAEMDALQKLYAMSDDDIAKLAEAEMN
ncbi:MAG: DUF262 domain-containing protein [Oscillospiraceae bacterium]|nr:DUF262 domain-containing protein [Oscillospiraceae bacterium]